MILKIQDESVEQSRQMIENMLSAEKIASYMILISVCVGNLRRFGVIIVLRGLLIDRRSKAKVTITIKEIKERLIV